MNVICFGDSNTYGYDPRSFFGERYPASARWVDIFKEHFGWNIQNDGMNGRVIPRHPVSIPADTDLFIIMLGTNDLLQGRSAVEASTRMNAFLESVQDAAKNILLIAPPKFQLGEWVNHQDLIDESHRVGLRYQEIAEQRGVLYLNSAEWGIELAYDGVHFTEKGHRVFAERLITELADCIERKVL